MSLSSHISEKAVLIWAVADKLTGVYKPHEYGEAILLLTVIRRFNCIQADTKDAMLAKYGGKNLSMRNVLVDYPENYSSENRVELLSKET